MFVGFLLGFLVCLLICIVLAIVFLLALVDVLAILPHTSRFKRFREILHLHYVMLNESKPNRVNSILKVINEKHI